MDKNVLSKADKKRDKKRDFIQPCYCFNWPEAVRQINTGSLGFYTFLLYCSIFTHFIIPFTHFYKKF